MFSAGFVPGSVSNATLGTFTPPAATADIDNHFSHAMMTERAQIAGGNIPREHAGVPHVRHVGPGQGAGGDAAPPGHHDRKLLQSPGSEHDVVPVGRDGVDIAQGPPGRARPESRDRPAAHRLRRDEREPAGSRQALGRHARQAAGVRQSDDAAIRSRDGFRGVRARTASSPARAGGSSSAGASITTRSPDAPTPRLAWEPRFCWTTPATPCSAEASGCSTRERRSSRERSMSSRTRSTPSTTPMSSRRSGLPALHARHGAEPRGRPQHGVGRGLRQAPESHPCAAPERARPARQPAS